MARDLINHIIEYNKIAAGRDKLCRVFQYGSKFGWWYCEVRDIDPDIVKKLKALESALSTTRKALRFGKSFDMLQSSLKAMHISDILYRFTISFARLNQALYLLYDHLVWLSRVGLIKDEKKKYTNTSYRFWLVSLIFNLVRNIYDIYKIYSTKTERNQSREGSCSRSPKQGGFANYVLENKPVFLDTVKNAADLTIPMGNLGYMNIPAGVQGLMGVLSSLIGMATIWNSNLKLVP